MDTATAAGWATAVTVRWASAVLGINNLHSTLRKLENEFEKTKAKSKSPWLSEADQLPMLAQICNPANTQRDGTKYSQTRQQNLQHVAPNQ